MVLNTNYSKIKDKNMDQKNEYLSLLKACILKEFEDQQVKIIIFGSRARDDYAATSDVDIGIIPHQIIHKSKITDVKEKIENLNIPYQVDIVNLTEVSEDFKNEILREALVWKDCS
jgi:uncharacterized protein